MSALALRKLQDPHFEDENEIVKHLRNKVKNGLDYTRELIGIDYEKAPKIPTFKGPDLSSIRFESFKEKDYFGNSWLLNTDYKFGRDPNNPFLKDFKFKTFDSTGIFHKTSATDAGVKDTMDDLKKK